MGFSGRFRRCHKSAKFGMVFFSRNTAFSERLFPECIFKGTADRKGWRSNAEHWSTNDERSPKAEILNSKSFSSLLLTLHFLSLATVKFVGHALPGIAFSFSRFVLLLELKQLGFQAFWNFSKGYLGGFQVVFAGVINRQRSEPYFSRRKHGFSGDFLPTALAGVGSSVLGFWS